MSKKKHEKINIRPALPYISSSQWAVVWRAVALTTIVFPYLMLEIQNGE